MNVTIIGTSIEVTGCPHCDDPEAENYGFTLPLRSIGDESKGRVCKMCSEWITGRDIEVWLEENEPDLLEEIRRRSKNE
jgi:hypothetical protein